MSENYRIFDRERILERRRKAKETDALYLFREGAAGLADKLALVTRTFTDALLIGPEADGGIFKAKPERITYALDDPDFDEEALTYKEAAFDVAVSNLSLHWVNDLPGALLQIRQVLKPDGLFLAVMFGAGTLHELRMSFLEAEAEIEGGASPRVSPFADVKDGGDLLQRAGFAMPVADIAPVTVTFADPLQLMHDLRAMGETNALIERRRGLTRRRTIMRAAEIYRDAFGDREGRVPATFQMLFLTGWAPGPNQPKPLKPGSAKVSLKDALK